MRSRTVGLQKRSAQDALRDQLVAQLRSQGGDPSLLLELLATIVEGKLWENADLSFGVFIATSYDRGGLGWSVENLRNILRLKHKFEDTNNTIADRMDKMRQEVERLLIVPARRHGGKRRGDYKPNQANNDNLKSAPASRAGILARLQRDRPDLAAKVIAGELSANQAAIEAGFRQKTVQVYPGDIERTIKTLRQHFEGEDLVEIIKRLTE